MKKDLISVIVPVYNVENYLKRCVESILKQNYNLIEILLVDDGSTDHSGQLCDEFAKLDDRIKVIHKENGGLSDARNTGLDYATGQYVMFIDSDDYIEKEMAEYLYREMKNGCDIAICGLRLVDQEGQIVGKVYEGKNEILDQNGFWDKYYNENSICYGVACNKMYPIHMFKHVRYQKGKIREDEYILHELINQCKKISYIPYIGYNYVQRNGSISTKKDIKLYIDVIEAYLKRAQYFEQSGNYKWMFMAVKGCMCQYYYMSKENEKCWGEKEVQDSYQRCRTFIERHRNNTREMKCRLQMMLFCMNIHLYNGMCRWVIKVRDNIL